VYKGAKPETTTTILSQVREELHPKLEAALDRKVKQAEYTVVPYRGVRRRQKKRISKGISYIRYRRYLNQKYYGGPWEGQT